MKQMLFLRFDCSEENRNTQQRSKAPVRKNSPGRFWE